MKRRGGPPVLLAELRELICQSRQRALRAVDTIQVNTCWELGRLYHAFPKRDALRHKLNWTHYRTLMRVDSSTAREWYMNEAAAQNWSSRALERQIGTLYYERLLASTDRNAIEREAGDQIQAIDPNLREFLRDPVLLEFLGMPNAGALLEARH